MLYLLALIVIILGAIVPPLWIGHLWLAEQQIKAPYAIVGLLVHVLLCGLLIAFFSTVPWGLITYCSLLLLAISVDPLLKLFNDRMGVKDIVNEDITNYLAALERQPGNAALHAALAKAYLDSKRYDEAIAAFERAIVLDPNHTQRERSQLREAMTAKEQVDKRRATSK